VEKLVFRCWGDKDKLMRDYHDFEWGVPLHDDYKLFEFLVLDGAQAGLSWSTILKKRENYRKAFDNFDFEKIAKYGDDKIEELQCKVLKICLQKAHYQKRLQKISKNVDLNSLGLQ